MPGPDEVFPNEPGVGIRPPSYLHGEVALTADTRDHAGYPTRGGVLRVAAAKYADKDLSAFAFAQYQVEGVQFVPLVRDTWVLALHGWGVFTDAGPGHTLPFYMLPSLGGANTLRGDRNYRWHDRHLLLATIESRVGVFEHMDATVFVDAGNVASSPGALNLGQRSVGAGIRVHTRTSTLVRIDVARGREHGWRVMLKLNDPLRLSRLGRRAGTLPFVP
jgi:outer membrane protein assembly factor BamA